MYFHTGFPTNPPPPQKKMHLLIFLKLQRPANRTHNPQLHTRPTTCKPKRQVTQAATICISLELLMMGIMVPETCWANSKFCNKKTNLLHLVGILFPCIKRRCTVKLTWSLKHWLFFVVSNYNESFFKCFWTCEFQTMSLYLTKCRSFTCASSFVSVAWIGKFSISLNTVSIFIGPYCVQGVSRL